MCRPLPVQQGTKRDFFIETCVAKSCFGAIQASVTELSITCRCTLLHSGQVNVRKSWPNAPGSIAASFMGEPQAVHCGPWFCLSSICCCSLNGQPFSSVP